MSELTFNLLRLGYLLLLWVFVASAVAVLRRDISVRGRSASRAVDEAAPGAWVSPANAAPTPPVPMAGPVGPPVGPAPIVVGPQAVGAVAPGPAPIVVGPAAAPAPGPAPVAAAPPMPAPEPIVVKPKPPRYLAIDSGALAGTVMPLSGQPITIGRAASNTLVIDDDYASSHHARIYPGPEGWVIEDLNSTNGTFVDGAQLRGAAPLTPDIPVTIGHSTIRLVV